MLNVPVFRLLGPPQGMAEHWMLRISREFELTPF
jgi:hypothetical protein